MSSRSLLTGFLLLAAALASAFFLADRLACLFQKPYKSAVYGYDTSYYYFWLRSGYLERPFDFRQSFELTRTMPDAAREGELAHPRTETGRVANKYGIGWAVATAPFFALADGLGAARNALAPGHPVARDGYGAPYQLAIFLGQFLYAVAGLAMAWRIVRRWVPEPEAAQGVLLAWLGSFLFAYQTTYLAMSHNTSFFALTACTLAALRIDEGKGRLGAWLALGAAGGLLVITHYQTSVYLLFPAWVAGRRLVRDGRAAAPGFALALAAGSALVFLQFLAWKVVYGHWLLYSYGGERFYWTRPHGWDVLFSPFHGLFSWSPALLVGAAGFAAWAAARRGAAALCWTASLAAIWYINASWWCWWFDSSFGNRAFEGAVLFFMLGTAWLLRNPRWKPFLVALLLLLAAFNLRLAYLCRKNAVSMDDPVTPAEMWRAAWHGHAMPKADGTP